MAEPLFTDRALQESYRALLAESTPGDHLDDATWDTLADGSAEAAIRDAAFDHVVACERCSRIWRGVLALKEEAETHSLIPRETPPPGPWYRSPLVALAAAASLVVVTGGFYLVRQQQPRGAEVTRNGGAVATIDALMVAYTPDGVPAFAWNPTPAANSYRVELFSDDGRPVWRVESTAPPVSWPASSPRAAGSYRWRVEGIADGAVVARSRLAALEVAP